MAIEMFDKNGNSKIVQNQEVQTMVRSGWSFQKPAVSTETGSKTKTTKRPNPILRIKEAKAEVIKPYNKENN